MDRRNVLIPFIEYYLGCTIESIEKKDSDIVFSTRWGRGTAKMSESGNLEVYVGDNKVSEIESKVFETVMESSKSPDVQKYYEDLKSILADEHLTFRSSCLIKDIMGSLEHLLINENVKVEGPIRIGTYFIFPLGDRKEIICLN